MQRQRYFSVQKINSRRQRRQMSLVTAALLLQAPMYYGVLNYIFLTLLKVFFAWSFARNFSQDICVLFPVKRATFE